MTERRLRELYVWLETHREVLVEHAAGIAEACSWVRHEAHLPMAADRLERVAFELCAALEQLDRIYPRDASAEEDTLVLGPQPVRRRKIHPHG